MIYLKLFYVFAKIGIFGFGGGIAMLPMIYQGAEEFGLMSKAEFSNLVGISQVTPGPLAINAATYVGYNAAGYPGAFVATFAVALPSFVLVLLTYYFINKFKESQVIQGAFTGIRPVTVGLIASAVIFIGQSAFVPVAVTPIVIGMLSVFLAGKVKLSPIWIIFGGAIIGALFCR